MTSIRTLVDFAGLWTLQRQINDHRSGTSGVFNGTASLTPVNNGLAYLETGSLQMEGHPPMTAERKYEWIDDGPCIQVLFEDGRIFHRFDPNAPRPCAEHFCDPDQYRATYDFGSWPEWTTIWDVVGPRKSYQLTSRYSRG